MGDAVNHPRHYNEHPSGIECIEIVRHMGFNLGNAFKYIWRADLKDDAIEDLRKAAFYIQDEITKREAHNRPLEALTDPGGTPDMQDDPKTPQSGLQRLLEGVQTFMEWAEAHGYAEEADKTGTGFVQKSRIVDAIAEARILGDRKISAPERNAWHEALNTISDLLLKKE